MLTKTPTAAKITITKTKSSSNNKKLQRAGAKTTNNTEQQQQQQQQQKQQQQRFTHSPELVVKTEDRRRMAEFPLSTSVEKGEEGRRLRRLLSRRDVARRSRMAQTLAE